MTVRVMDSSLALVTVLSSAQAGFNGIMQADVNKARITTDAKASEMRGVFIGMAGRPN